VMLKVIVKYKGYSDALLILFCRIIRLIVWVL
jgi:hypothetical protein